MDDCISEFKRVKLEQEARRNWDLFYKRNADAFFKDRHWTRDELARIIQDIDLTLKGTSFLEIGCGVGNLLFPLAGFYPDSRLYGVDFSKNAIDLLNRRASEEGIADRVSTSTCDITDEATVDGLLQTFPKVDVATMVFVLSSIAPEKQSQAIANVKKLLKPGGNLIVRDYASMDHTMLRFGRGSKIGERFYKRADGTRAYFFTKEELEGLFVRNGFVCQQLECLQSKTVNRKKQMEVDRFFVQGRFVIPKE